MKLWEREISWKNMREISSLKMNIYFLDFGICFYSLLFFFQSIFKNLKMKIFSLPEMNVYLVRKSIFAPFYLY